MKAFLTIAAVLIWQSVAVAQDGFGTVTVSIDGKQSAWEMAQRSGTPKSNWRGDSATAHINLQAVSVPEMAGHPRSLLSVGFYLTGVGAANFVNEVDIVLNLPTETGAYVTVGHGAGSIIDLQSARMSGGRIDLKGAFSVELLFTDDFGVTLDADRVRTVAGNFEVELALE